MKKIFYSIAIMTFSAVVQAASEMPADMQNIMEQAMQAQNCMQNIDPAAMEAMEKRGNEIEAEVEALCKKGQRAKAQKKAIKYGREMMDSQVIKDMRKCSEMMRGVIPEMTFDDFTEELKNKHVCDDM